MAISDFFFGAKMAESAVNKARGRGKVVDGNIQGGKKESKKGKKVEDAETIDEVFSFIGDEIPDYVLGQEEYLARLCLAFKRPHISTQNKSYKNMIFVLGPEGSGRKYSIRVLAKLLTIKKLEKESSIYYLDFSHYDSDEAAERLLLPDLYKAFYGKSPIVIIDNFDLSCAKARDYISNLGINGVIKLNKRFAWKNGTFTEATGSFDIGTSDSISANGKYIVLLSKKNINSINQLFSHQFLDEINDVLETKKLSKEVLYEIAKAELDDCNQELSARNGLTISFGGMISELIESLDLRRGAHDIIEAIHKQVYDPIIEKSLQSVFRPGDVITLAIKDRVVLGNGVELSALRTSVDAEELDRLDQELDQIIGLESVKEFIGKLRKHIELEIQHNRITSELSLHMIFCGNPGTGKTTIARLVARYLKALGCISSGHLVEVTRGDMVGQYLGQTAPKTADIIKSALGGVLFIDEAYSLSRNKEDFFGIEAIDTLVKYMEDHRGELVVILAGYTKEMDEFLDTNSGLKSRFNYVIEFPDYSAEELLQITDITAKKSHFTIDDSCRTALMRYYSEKQKEKKKDTGNGRLVRNTVEKAILAHSQRMADAPFIMQAKEQEETLTLDDFELKENESQEDISALDQELASIVGLDPVKDFITKLKKHIEFEQKSGLKSDMSLHMVFCGNPGTGKTTIARLVARYFKALGVLSNGQLIEVSRADLVAGYVGQTAIKTNAIIDRAIGGILFIDEAYSLVRDSQDSFGLEAVDTLVKGMEDHRDDLVVILAGYTKEMAAFMKSNSGLKSRFNYTVEFPDYSAEELMQISDVIVGARQFRIDSGCRQALFQYYQKQQSTGRNDSGNGRLVRNTVEKAIFNHSQRLAEIGLDQVSPDELQLLSAQDFQVTEQKRLVFDLESELVSIVGLESVKDYVRSLYATLRVNKARAELGIPVEDTQTMHMIFTGNPGTGKTTMARIVARILYEMEALPINKLVETDRASLVAGYVGQTAEKTLCVLEQARGGVLFVDEAYSLASGGEQDFGREAIDTMVKYMEDHRSEIVIILAGYTQDMQRFLSMNPGLTSRFPTIIEFPNYSSEELLTIAKGMYAAKHFELSPGTDEKLLEIFEEERNKPQFGNGRFARNLCEKSIRNLSMRVTMEGVFTKEALTLITPRDITV